MSTHPTTPDQAIDHVGAPTQHGQSRTRTPAPPATCTRCAATWTGLNVAHCAACHRTFASPGLFDRHRYVRGETGGCIDPSTIITARTGNSVMVHRGGMWRSPEMAPDARARFAALSAAPTELEVTA